MGAASFKQQSVLASCLTSLALFHSAIAHMAVPNANKHASAKTCLLNSLDVAPALTNERGDATPVSSVCCGANGLDKSTCSSGKSWTLANLECQNRGLTLCTAQQIQATTWTPQDWQCSRADSWWTSEQCGVVLSPCMCASV